MLVSKQSCGVAHLLLALGMEIYTLDGARDLVEANIVEALEACAADGSDSVVWHQEVFLPAHEQMLFLYPILCD